MQWVILAVLSLVQALTLSLIPLLSGYSVRVLSGKKPAPEIDDWVGLFVDGWKLNIITLVYMLPAIIVFLVLGGLGAVGLLASEAAGGDPAAAGAAVLSLIGGFLLAAIVTIIMSFIALFATMRFAHKGSLGEAFNFSAILGHIGKPGWGTWIISVIVLIVIAFVYGFVVGIVNMIPFLGFNISLPQRSVHHLLRPLIWRRSTKTCPLPRNIQNNPPFRMKMGHLHILIRYACGPTGIMWFFSGLTPSRGAEPVLPWHSSITGWHLSSGKQNSALIPTNEQILRNMR